MHIIIGILIIDGNFQIIPVYSFAIGHALRYDRVNLIG